MHVFPLRAVWVPLVIKVVLAVVVEHAVGVVHPAVGRSVVVERPVRLAVRGVEICRLAYMLPAHIVLEAAVFQHVAQCVDVEQNFTAFIAGYVERHVVIHFVGGEPDVERLPCFVVVDNADVANAGFFFYRQEYEPFVRLELEHGVRLAGKGRCGFYIAGQACKALGKCNEQGEKFFPGHCFCFHGV